MKSELVLVRHGLTEGNLKHWFYGGIDIPLAEEGRRKLAAQRAAGIYPPVPDDAQVFTSGLIRTEETLEITYGKRPHDVIPELREFSFGEYEARTYDELTEEDGEAKAVFDRWAYDETGELALPGGESRNGFAARIARGVEILLGKHREYAAAYRSGNVPDGTTGQTAGRPAGRAEETDADRAGGPDDASADDMPEMPTTLMVCHGGVISQMLIDMFGLRGTLWDYVPDPGLGYIVRLEDGEPASFGKFGGKK